MDKWLKCDYCGSEIHADTIGGDLNNHQCKDRQIANQQTRIAGMEAELANYGETVKLLREQVDELTEHIAAHKSAWSDLVAEYNLELEGNRVLQADLQGCRDRLEAWHDLWALIDVGGYPTICNIEDMPEIDKLRSLGEL